jgi:hypothetical protein
LLDARLRRYRARDLPVTIHHAHFAPGVLLEHERMRLVSSTRGGAQRVRHLAAEFGHAVAVAAP